MKRFMTFFCITVICVTLLLITLAGCDGCIPGDASRECINRSIRQTEQAADATAAHAADELHIQLTLQAGETK